MATTESAETTTTSPANGTPGTLGAEREKSPATQFVEPKGITRRNTANTARRPTAETERADSNGNGTGLGRQPTRQTMLSRIATTLTSPGDKKLGPAPSLWRQFRAIIFSSWFNVLLVFIPLSWAFHFAKLNNTLVFVFSFLAIVPLAKLLAFATEEVSLRTNQTIAGLLNATLGNAVELIVAIIALIKCELQVVQASLIGSILSNLLLVLGMCFFAGGTRFSEQGFGISAAQLNSSLLVMAVIAVLLPAAFDYAVTQGQNGGTGRKITTDDPDYQFDILHLSHGVAIILLLIYVSYIIFQLYTHTHLYEDANDEEVSKSKKYNLKHRRSEATPTDTVNGSAEGGDAEANPPVEEEEEEEQPQTSALMALILLAMVTVLVAVTAEFLVGSIDELTDGGNSISKEFVSIILLAIVGNAAEHVTAVTVSVKDKLTLSIGVAVGSSIQIALFVIPFMVTLGWIIGIPLTLLFDPLESVVLFFAVLAVNYIVADGKSNWLEGAILCFFYIIVGIIFFFYPGSDPRVRYEQLTCHPRTR